MPALCLRTRVLLSQSIRFRFLITLLVLFTFSMFLLSAWWQVNSLITAFFPLPTFHNLQMLILLLIVPAVMLVVVGCLILKHSLLSHFDAFAYIYPRTWSTANLLITVQSIHLISHSKRENTRIVARTYVVQFLILSAVIGIFGWTLSLPGVQKLQGLGLVNGIGNVGFVRFPLIASSLQNVSSNISATAS